MFRYQFYNQIINFFWTIISFVPILIFWYQYYKTDILIIAIAISMVPFFIPADYFKILQLSKNRRFYENLGIRTFLKFTQNGSIVNRMIRNNNPGYKIISNKKSFNQFYNQLIVYEKYHYACLVFFLISFLIAVYLKEYLQAVLIMLVNFIYNFIPILIQQYHKIKLKRL